MPTLPTSITKFAAKTQFEEPPRWALLERELFARLDTAVDPFLAKYTRHDGTLVYRQDWPNGRDGLDDLYESFYNFPLAYLLGGPTRLLELGHRQWEAMTRQGASYGLVHKEFEVGYDQFHQSEGYMAFYLLCAADPENPRLQERARRFAGFYLGEDPAVDNYDAEHNIIRAVHTGSMGPRWGYVDGDSFWNNPRMAPYGLPFEDMPGITSHDDIASYLGDERRVKNAHRMIEVMNDRMGKGDSASNLPVTSLVTNAFLTTGEPKYREWVQRYVGGWWRRAAENGDLLPDNVGLDGEVGTNFDGRWYGAAYGWSWPHGYDSVIDAAVVGAINATLLTGDTAWLDLPSRHFDMLYDMGRRVEDYRDLEFSLSNAWVSAAAEASETFDAYVMPKRHGDSGWFDDQTVGVANLLSTWIVSHADEDRARMRRLEQDEPYDWAQSFAFHSKGDDGHERPWLAFLEGRYPDYPETILSQSLETIEQRLEMIRTDNADLTRVHIHHWQQRNPVTTEALLQLTLGAPQALYNGGFIHSCVRYFDPDASRPGLPADVGALVSEITATGAVLHLVNLSESETRRVLVQGGFHGEHRILWAAAVGSAPVAVGGRYMIVDLHPGTEIKLEVALARLAAVPSYDLPDYQAYSSDRTAGAHHV